MMKTIILYDDFNSKIPRGGGQDVCGTVTTQFGNPAPRHGYKVIEIYEDEHQNTTTDQEGLH